MSFATQEEVFAVAEEVFPAIIEKFSDKPFTKGPFPRITYADAMLKYGTDKPDLRNPLFIIDLSDQFVDSDFKPFSNKTVRGIRVPGMGEKSKTFFKSMEEYALSIGMKGLGYVKVDENMSFLGPIDKFLTDASREEIKRRAEEKAARGQYSYEYRAAQNHLSFEQANDWLVNNAADYSRICYLHQHRDKGGA